MTIDLIKEILRRLESKWKADGNEDPIASIRLWEDEGWTIIVQDDEAEFHEIESGKGYQRFSELLNELRGS